MNQALATTVLTKARTMIANLPNNDSANLCLEDAEALFERGDYVHCVERAERAVLYVAGVVGKKVEKNA